MRRLIAGVAFLFSVGAAMAQTSIPPVLPANPEPGVATPATVPTGPVTDDTIICKYERNTGTLLMVQVCRTHRAWKLMQSDAQEFMEFGFRGSHQTDENASGN